jgi:hypothetical protein
MTEKTGQQLWTALILAGGLLGLGLLFFEANRFFPL